MRNINLRRLPELLVELSVLSFELRFCELLWLLFYGLLIFFLYVVSALLSKKRGIRTSASDSQSSSQASAGVFFGAMISKSGCSVWR